MIKKTTEINRFLNALKNCDTVKTILTGIGEESFSTEEVYKYIKELESKQHQVVFGKPFFEWIKCKRKNGTEFLKLIYYSNNAGGNIEAGRFNMAKSEQVNNDWTIQEILNEIKN